MSLSPEEKALVLAMAGPLTAEMSKIENTTYDDQGYKLNTGLSVKDQLARSLERDFGGHNSPPTPQQGNYETFFYPPDINNIPQNNITPGFLSPPVPFKDPNDPQLEFQFDQREQVKTNDLLEKILTKLSKIFVLLESTNNTTEKVVKLKP